MNLLAARQAYLEGKRVRKKNWHTGTFVKLEPNGFLDTELNKLFDFDNDSDGDSWEIVN